MVKLVGVQRMPTEEEEIEFFLFGNWPDIQF